MTTKDSVFAGSVPGLYQALLVPMIFDHYAEDIARRLVQRPVDRLLEIAAGTGVVTRALANVLPSHTTIVATDLNSAMIDEASRIGTSRAVEWRTADAMRLPFADGAFDTVVCQFGAMFFPDKVTAFAEARRVLEPGGIFLFNVWDRIADNHFSEMVTTTLAERYPVDPPLFLARTPHGYHDPTVIERDLRMAGFKTIQIEAVSATSRASSARSAAEAFCQGTPLRGEIEAREPSGLDAATKATQAALERRFGRGPIESKMQAIVVLATS